MIFSDVASAITAFVLTSKWTEVEPSVSKSSYFIYEISISEIHDFDKEQKLRRQTEFSVKTEWSQISRIAKGEIVS